MVLASCRRPPLAQRARLTAYRSFLVILAAIIQATECRRIPLAVHRALRYLFAKPERLSAQTCCEDPAARQQDEPTDKANVGRRMALKSRSQPKSGAAGFALTSHYVRRRLHPA